MYLAMKTLSATLTLLLLTIMSFKSYAQSPDTIKYSYNDTGTGILLYTIVGQSDDRYSKSRC